MQIPFFLLGEKTQCRIREQERLQAEAHKKRAMERTQNCVKWTHNIKWEKELNIIASTYKPNILFDNIEPTDKVNQIHALEKGQYIDSPSGKYRFTVNIIRKGKTLSTICGSRSGDVVFDGDVLTPALYQKQYNDRYDNPWMSITPFELLSLRPGTKKAKGHTIVAGLGLGYQLVEVANRRSVKEITLIERDQELIDWILPRLRDKYPNLSKLKNIVVNDAHEVIKDMVADVALIDIFPSYGSNGLYCFPKNIETVWCWGACNIKGDECWYY